MNLFTYRLLTRLAAPIIGFASWKRCRKHAQQRAKENTSHTQADSNLDIPYCFRSRLALNPTPMQKGGIWIHAVSVGETRSIFNLLTQLHHAKPELPITLTNSSLQGAIHAQAFCPVPFQQHLLPLDYISVMRRFLKQVQPKLVIMVETEIWPNLYQACHELNIPIVLINARLKQNSFQAYQKWGGKLITNTLKHTQWISPQTNMDAEYFAQLGVPSSQLKTLGNLKSDITLDIKQQQTISTEAQAWRLENGLQQRPIWIAASTHAAKDGKESEESLMLKAHKAVLQNQPNALLIIAPRHAERFDEVAQEIIESGLHWQRRSEKPNLKTESQVYLADSLGELMHWYAVADIAFVGGSLVPFGGHNILEPAAVNTPIISGKHFQNLANMFTPFIEQKAITLVDSPEQLAEQISQLFTDKEKAAQQAETAFSIMQQQTGAVAATLKALLETLNKSAYA